MTDAAARRQRALAKLVQWAERGWDHEFATTPGPVAEDTADALNLIRAAQMRAAAMDQPKETDRGSV